MRKFLQNIKIIQTQRVTDGTYTFYYKRRLNPYNPLSYVFIPLVLIAGVLMFGFKGMADEMSFKNPFKWQ